MQNRRIVRGVKVVGAVAAGVLLTASVGSASATPTPVAGEPAEVALPAAVTAAVQPTSWRDSVVAAGAGTATTARPATRPSRQVSAARAQAAAYAKFRTFTLHSKATKDMRGVEPSLYRGTFYRTAIEAKRRCIVDRESEGHYDVVNPSGSYRGAYQVSAQLARGATWMMLKEHKKLMGKQAAKSTLAALRSKPMNTWPRYWQDAAFHTVANWEHTGSGLAHWGGGRWHC